MIESILDQQKYLPKSLNRHFQWGRRFTKTLITESINRIDLVYSKLTLSSSDGETILHLAWCLYPKFNYYKANVIIKPIIYRR